MINTHNVITERFIAPFANRRKGNVGIEIEMPLINAQSPSLDMAVVRGLLPHMLGHGFKVEESMGDGSPAFIINDAGDVLSFDNAYNNFEFSMQYSSDIKAVAARFYAYFDKVQEYLLARGHMLCCIGASPYMDNTQPVLINFPVYGMVRRFLREYPALHRYKSFPAYISSSQTHLDVELSELPYAFTLFCKLDFVRALLFSNSPYMDINSDIVCIRDYMWERSAFGVTGNVGKNDIAVHTLSDIIELFANKTLFNRKRDGEYQTFYPIKLADYFNSHDATGGDIKQYLSFKTVEITSRGTLETRSDCTQPIEAAFAPAAFATGILYNMQKAASTLDSFIAANNLRGSNSALRDRVCYYGRLFADSSAVSQMLLQLLDIAAEGLRKRGNGEESLLNPLYTRAEQLTNPATQYKAELQRGTDMITALKTISTM